MQKVILTLLVTIAGISLFAQAVLPAGGEIGKGTIKVGIKTGLVISTADIKYSDGVTTPTDISAKPGWLIGAFLEIPVTRKVEFNPELRLVVKGYKIRDEFYDNKVNLSYIELPLNLVYKATNEKGSFFIGGGPAPAFYVGETVVYSGYNAVKDFDVGFNILTGYEIPIGFSIGIHYTHGLSDVSLENTATAKINNRSFGLAIGYTF